MLIQLLFVSTAHFTLTVFSAFVFFAAGLLYFDSWHLDTHKKTPLLRALGFFLLAAASALHATSIEIPPVLLLGSLGKIAGLIFILLSLVREPLLSPPLHPKLAMFIPFVLPAFSPSLTPLSAVLTMLIAATYWRKSSQGLEQQLKPACLAFLSLSLAESLAIPFYWSSTPVIFWSKILSDYGLLSLIQHSFELIGVSILAIWVWGYLRFRLQVQLFVSTLGMLLLLFLTTTVFYTFLLLNNLEADALAHLRTNVNVLQYSLESVKGHTLVQAQAIARDNNIKQALLKNDRSELSRLTTDYLTTHNTDTLLIASSAGDVVMRAEDQDRRGDHVGSKSEFMSALAGHDLSSVTYNEGATVPLIGVLAAVPIRESTGSIIGVVMTGITLDSAFVDGVKSVTGLDTTVFGQDKRAATTFLAPDGKSRHVGTIETNPEVLETVLGRGEIYVGKAPMLNLPYYTAFGPLKTNDGEVIGMLFVGELQNTLTDTAKKSINLTYLGSMILLILTIIPTYFFSRFLREHQGV